MDKYTIYLTGQFEFELERILYYSKYSPKMTRKLYFKIKNSVMSLQIFPERFSRIYIVSKSSNNIRKMVVGKFIIIYEVDVLLKQVYILHIFYGNQNYFSQL